MNDFVIKYFLKKHKIKLVYKKNKIYIISPEIYPYENYYFKKNDDIKEIISQINRFIENMKKYYIPEYVAKN